MRLTYFIIENESTKSSYSTRLARKVVAIEKDEKDNDKIWWLGEKIYFSKKLNFKHLFEKSMYLIVGCSIAKKI